MHSSNLLLLRRIAVLCLIVAGLLLSIPNKLSAQACGGYGEKPKVTSLGTEFLLCFMQNEAPGYDPSNTRYQDIYLAATDQPADITITCKAYPKYSKVIHLNAGGAISYRIPSDPALPYPGSDAIIESDELVDQTVFRVVSTTPIACYGMNNKQYTADAFLALPKSVAGYDYLVMSYFTSTQLAGQEMPSEFCVASFEDSNTVTITPTALTRQAKPAGSKLTFVLNAGEAVQIQADPFTAMGDLTGSQVTSTKKVVVYGGHARTEAPIGYFYVSQGNQRTSRDHLCEAIPPLADWGTSFITKNFGRSGGDVLRVLANPNPGTTDIKVNGKPWITGLKPAAFRDTILPLGNLATDNIFVIESNNPILVGMIAHSAVDDGGTGDPFLAIVPPLNESYNDFTYFISDDPNYFATQQFLIIATDQNNKGILSIDNKIVPALGFTDIPNFSFGGNHYTATTLNQTPGIHRIVSPPSGFTILAYGWGNVISYDYTAGYLLKPISGIMPKSSHSHSVAPSTVDRTPNPPPSITVKDILSERVYFDSARITYTQNKKNISVRLKNDIALETGTIESTEEKTLELTTSKPVEDVIAGNVRIWYHSRLWVDMLPVDFPFIITPQSQADVNASQTAFTILENYPNPASGKTTVHFRIPSRAYASVKIYDALGRTIRTVSQGIVNSNDQDIQVSTKGITPGEYTLELVAPELGISEHRHLIVIE